MQAPKWTTNATGALVAGTLLVFATTAVTHLISALPPFHPVLWEMENGDRCYGFAGRLACFEPETTKKAISCE